MEKQKKNLKVEDIARVSNREPSVKIAGNGSENARRKARVQLARLRTSVIQNLTEGRKRPLAPLADFFKPHLKRAVVFALLVCIVGATWHYAIRTRAQVARFYPTACLGNWLNIEQAQGQPKVEAGAGIDRFNGQNSAVYNGGSKQIFCGGFQGDLPESADVRSVVLKLSWALEENGVSGQGQPGLVPESGIIDAVVEQAGTSSPESASSTLNSAQPPADEILPSSSLDSFGTEAATGTKNISSPEPLSQPQNDIPNNTDDGNGSDPGSESREQNNIPSPDQAVPGTSFFLFPEINIAHAEESGSGEAANQNILIPGAQPGEQAPEVSGSASGTEPAIDAALPARNETNAPTFIGQPAASSGQAGQENSIFIIKYSLDGNTWQAVAKPGADNFQNQYELPIANTEDLSKVQISIESVPGQEKIYTVFLAGMALEVEYSGAEQEAPKQVQTEPVPIPQHPANAKEPDPLKPVPVEAFAERREKNIFTDPHAPHSCRAEPFVLELTGDNYETAAFSVFLERNGRGKFERVELGNLPLGFTASINAPDFTDTGPKAGGVLFAYPGAEKGSFNIPVVYAESYQNKLSIATCQLNIISK